jgi:hypothetical protein
MTLTTSRLSNAPPGHKNAKEALRSLMQDSQKVLAWVSVTPNWLRTALVAIVILSVTFALAIRHAAEGQIQAVKTIAKDASPSILAGQGMRASLADMHSNLANELLAEPGAGKQTVDDFNKRRSEAVEDLLAAARNITYAGEVPPVRTVLNELPRYEEFAARARLLHDQRNTQFLAEHQAVDEVMRTKLLPAIDDLVVVNQRELDRAYQTEKTAAKVAWQLVLWTGGALLAAIVGVKVLLYLRMRRVVNPPLLAAAVLTACGWLWALVALWQSSSDLKVAKQDAFDSIAVLEAARATAYEANGDESRWLLNKIKGGKPDQIQLYATSFHEKAAKIAATPLHLSDPNLLAEVDRLQKSPAALTGYLAKELNNITFPNEFAAARETLQTFLTYLKIDQQIRDLKDEQQAVELCLGTKPGQSNWAFAQFDTALSKTNKINRSYFESSMADAASWLRGLDWLLPLGLTLGVSLLTLLGLRPRLREYAIH